MHLESNMVLTEFVVATTTDVICSMVCPFVPAIADELDNIEGEFGGRKYLKWRVFKRTIQPMKGNAHEVGVICTVIPVGVIDE